MKIKYVKLAQRGKNEKNYDFNSHSFYGVFFTSYEVELHV